VLSILSPTEVGPVYKWREYVNRETGRTYKPKKHRGEDLVIYSDSPKHILIKGGEGGGKSVGGIIKDLERLRRGMTGIMVSPDFEHFKKSLWAEFRRWCPLESVIERERYRLRTDWEPSKQFELHFHNEYGGLSTLYCGGMDDPTGWHGPNVSFAHGDEVRRKDDADILKVLSGRVRIPGPKGEPPQLWFTTTPKKHWLFDFFGGVPNPFGEMDVGQEHFKKDDPRALFKSKAVVVTLYTLDNEENLADDYAEDRGSTLTESERRVFLEAQWEDEDDVQHFLHDMALWDACYDSSLPGLTPYDPLVMAVDGAYASKGDVFAMILAGPHPFKEDVVAIRGYKMWEAKGVQRDFDDIESDIKDVCLKYAIGEIVYDPRELHHMMTRLRKAGQLPDKRWWPGVMTTEFPQGVLREQSDKALLDRIVTRRIAHVGQSDIRTHVYNADRKTTEDGKRIRIVKRQRSMKIDLAVCTSMAAFNADSIMLPWDAEGSSSKGPFK
jgi:hypothetical protein